jgi:hypothetical protein
MSLFGQLSSLVGQAITANETNDQATLDAIHTQMLSSANALRPAGTDPLT